MIDRRQLIAMAGLTAVASTAPRKARAAVPFKTARLQLGFAAGGSVDYVARLLAEHLKDYAETIVVENIAGAGGRIVLQSLVNAPADGSVMVLTPGDQLSLFPHLYRNLPYDPRKHFTAVSTVCTVQFLLTIGPAVPASVTTLKAFIAWGRDNPTLATYGTSGVGTRQHLLGVALAQAAGFEFTHVPYKGAAPALQDVLAGQIAANISVISNPLPHIAEGKLRALATTARLRSGLLPHVPTAREAGYAALEALETFGLLLPQAVPRAAVDALNNSVRRALSSPAVKAALSKLQLDAAGSTPKEYADLIAADLQSWDETVRLSGLSQSISAE
ncbi:Bug family tripartite tricarboxylate transporter substrate binding protein [Bosea eneae]|uniref:Bug family tripartite tricarboxylate transporter substrate binding protein n=1 Tax=Bosea eneae TaxID=151454 RepID=A0ABW0IIN3_9HYPH